ncbi:MAG: PQQ-binding-like beta-propeller repeat protein [Lachnospiraceae bacterium]|nr:hypothetical protein [Lachnospiraceae bacterium]MBQ9491061.1 PQQ-binding-like beta-propeller repeat protein [Lachnospiraceae bacterium]MBR3507769.1 PQQ-binding-like beta-propeller repeat protein [Lachnospiraceae bacterium]MBR4606050.1 PQQ-binding-like beta-propeller repeat protein [Lachnospiraceae bacterium]MBR6152446.1 PQQ-binding-like beta-propeller repeat protein [Lachnospiraceae bacterium]
MNNGLVKVFDAADGKRIWRTPLQTP